MGDQHRSDSDHVQDADRERGHDRTPRERTSRRDADDAAFDTAHARAQHAYHAKDAVTDSPTAPAKTVESIGDAGALLNRYDAAKQAKNATDVLAVVRDMGTETRRFIAGDLVELATFLSSRQVLLAGGLAEAGADATLLAALAASPPLTRSQVRAFLADLGHHHLDRAFSNTALVPALRARFPGSPAELLPQLGGNGGLRNEAVLTWLLETSSPKVVARLLLEVEPEWVAYQADTLDKLGERGWQWLDAVDAQIAAATKPATLRAYRSYVTRQTATADVGDVEHGAHLTQLDRWEQVAKDDDKRSAAKVRGDAASLRARRSDVIAKSTVLQIQQRTENAGMAPAEQLAWILDKPGLTAAQLREVTSVMVLDEAFFSPALVTKLQRRFPKVQVEELFSGGVPRDLIMLGALDRKVGRWLLDGAAPETILRIVASQPEMIDEWCATLAATGVGFGWVRELGGFHNDHLLRRFVLKCPDPATREYVEQRLLGDDPNPGTTKAAPVAAPTAYTSARSHLDTDLDRASKAKPSKETSDTIAADIRELTADELEALRHDARRLRQLLATVNQKTFPQILGYVQPELQVAAVVATPQNITASDFMAWAPTRPAREVVAALANAITAERVPEVVEPYGPFEVFPQIARAEVLAPVLQRNPELIEWVMASEPSQVIRAFGAPAVIDAAVRALSALDDVEALDAWPSAEALGPGGRSVLVQLAARAKGEVRAALDAKLQAKETRGDADAGYEATPDQLSVTLHGDGRFRDRLAALLVADAPEATVLALCRANARSWHEAAAAGGGIPALTKKLAVSPEVAFPGIGLATMLAHSAFRSWVLSTTHALKVLKAIEPRSEGEVAAVIDDATEPAKQFLDSLPRGRGLSGENKATLHRLSKLVKVDARVEQLFEIAFDSPARQFSRVELDKLWSVLAVLPHAHVDQKSISGYFATQAKPGNTTAGVYRPDTQSIELQQGKLASKDAAQYDHGISMSEAEAIEALGSKAELDRFIADGLMTRHHDGTYSFTPKQGLAEFPHTILHEVGHAVDYMLGAQTELVYGLAGWKRFAHGDFDGWAQELGGWDTVVDADKREIRKVWISWLSGGAKGTVAAMVDSDHPAVANRYAKVGVVQLASIENVTAHALVNGRYAAANHATQSWTTLSSKGYHASPSAYALTAPEEYFAECYANYYREFDGTAQSASKKGATLAPWIKTWFDTNIDKVGHNPQRNGRR